MSESEVPVSASQADPFPLFDRAGYASLVGSFLLFLITFFTSYSHVDVFGVHFNINQQIGIPCLFAALAALVGEVKLASNGRSADQSTREREANEAARERGQATRRSGIQARCLVAQCRFLLADTAINRLQLSEALALLMETIKTSEA